MPGCVKRKKHYIHNTTYQTPAKKSFLTMRRNLLTFCIFLILALVAEEILYLQFFTDFKESQSAMMTNKEKKKEEKRLSSPPPGKMTTNSSTMTMTNSTGSIRFIFVVGLEGTGHHFYGSVVKASPGLHHLKKVLKADFSDTKQIQFALWNQKKFTGLWNIHACLKPKDICQRTTIEERKALATQRLVNSMKQLEDHINARLLLSDSHQPMQGQFVVPLNTAVSELPIGQMSYPNFLRPSRKENNPQLDTLYDACTLAKVDCRHVYIYRDPLQILLSTTVKRRYNEDLSMGVDLYEGILRKTILPQLTTFQEHSLGCAGFYEEIPTWKERMATWWQWDHQDAFDIDMKGLRVPTPENRTALDIIASMISEDETTQHRLESWQQIHNKIIQDLC